jgi:hypothetical protein
MLRHSSEIHNNREEKSMQKIISLTTLSALFLCGTVQAENYAGIAFSKLTKSSSSTGASIMLGHRYNEYLAGEIAYEDSGAISASATGKTTALSMAAVGIMPFGKELEGYARLGYASARTTETDKSASHGDITYGIGLSYRVNEHYSASLGWDHLRVGDNTNIPRSNENSYAIGVVRNF